jgi:amino acid permease
VVRDRHGHPQTGCEDRVCQNIVLNLADGPVKSAIGLTLCFAIIISYVMILAPARENLESFFLRSTGVRAPWAVNLSRNVLRALLVLATALVAVVTPYFGSVLGTVGGLTDALQAFVLPPLISVHMASTHMGGPRLSPRRRIAYAAITAWGLATMVYTAVKIAKNGLDFETGADR